ncbi:MAG: LLM class flavin-dependent oxidoreductase [Microthrixaceae bacterium]
MAREEPLEFDGEFYQHPYHGPGSMGLGKLLKAITHPPGEIPIFLGAEGPENVTMTAEIADGWIPSTTRRSARTSTPSSSGASDDSRSSRWRTSTSPTTWRRASRRSRRCSRSTSGAWARRARTSTPT